MLKILLKLNSNRLKIIIKTLQG